MPVRRLEYSRTGLACFARRAVPMPFQLAPNAVVGTYRLDHLVGAGGMGVVWAARHVDSDARVAIKFLKSPDFNDGSRSRFVKEVQATRLLEHPNIVSVRDVLEADDGSLGLVMELLVGESLASRSTRSSLSLREVAALTVILCDAVAAAHQRGVIHRDLKHENIFLVHDGSVRVLDFGVAKITSLQGDVARSAGTQTGTLLGTPLFMSPEQVFGEKDIDGATDVWSLGIVLYQLLSGRLPTESESLGQTLKIIVTRAIPPLASLAPGTPWALCRIVDQMLSFRREDRPSLSAVRDAFGPFTDVQTRADDPISPLAVTVAAASPQSLRIVAPPETQYVDNNGVSIAYQVFGDGPIHLVIIPGLMSHLEAYWEYPAACRFLSMVGSLARVIMIDKRGSGLSERLPGDVAPSLAQRVDDVRAVLEAQKVSQCVLMGFSEGGPMCVSFAATHPDRTLAVILFGTRARFKRGAEFDALMSLLRSEWGRGGFSAFLSGISPDEQTLRWFAKVERLTATPRGAAALLDLLPTMDVVPLLSQVKAPTLVMRRAFDVVASAGAVKQLASGIKDAELIEYPFGGHHPMIGDYESLLADVASFLARKVLPARDTLGAP